MIGMERIKPMKPMSFPEALRKAANRRMNAADPTLCDRRLRARAGTP
jgi:hypothetical protein